MNKWNVFRAIIEWYQKKLEFHLHQPDYQYMSNEPNSRVAIGVKNLWATNILGPKKAMHFRKVHYLVPGWVSYTVPSTF